MFEFESEDQLEVRRAVRKISESELPKYQTDEWYGKVPLPFFREAAKLGLAGLSVSEEHGGLGADPVTVMIAREELAKVDMGPAIFISVHNMVSGLINKFGNDSQRSSLLPPLAAGEKLGAFCLSEPNAGSDAGNLSTRYDTDGEEFILNGEKCWITSAGWADLYLTFARTTGSKGKDGISAFIVPSDTPGLTISEPEKKMGCELSPIASVNYENVRLPKEALLSDELKGYRVALGGLAGGRINIAAIANGVSKAALTLGLRHLKERKQFGEPLIHFQGLQFMLSDLHMQLEAAELLTWQAAKVLHETPNSRQNRLFPSEAKCFATDTAMKITTDAVQFLGGAGYVREYGVEKLMRDAKMLQIVEGANQVQRMVIARELAEKEGF